MKTQVTIERETAKAYLVADSQGRQGWIQKRWLRDGQVNSETFEKAVATQEKEAAWKERCAAWKEDFHPVTVTRETEKAIAIEIVFERCDGEKEISRFMWFPKSQVRNGNEVPGWLLAAKNRELEIPQGWFLAGVSRDLFTVA